MTREEIAKILKLSRENAGMTQKQAAESIGRKQQTLASWETGQSQPDANTLFVLFNSYGISIDTAFGFNPTSFSDIPTNRESKLLTNFRVLNDTGQSKALEYIDDLTQTNKYKIAIKKAPLPPKQESLSAPDDTDNNTDYTDDTDDIDDADDDTLIIPYYDLPASAGTGIYLTGADCEDIHVPRTPTTSKASFAIRVSGDSMEPYYNDMDILLVKEQPSIKLGECGIFILRGEGYFKKLGKKQLLSLNAKYPPINVSNDDEVKCCGKVIGRL